MIVPLGLVLKPPAREDRHLGQLGKPPAPITAIAPAKLEQTGGSGYR